MLKIVRVNSNNTAFIDLVKLLDEYLKIVDGDDHDFYNQFNNVDVLKNAIVAYLDNKPIGCGAFKEYDKNCIEIKRMYTKPNSRGKDVATKILQELEIWALELKFNACILETGKRQIEAVQFYKKNNYAIIPNYGQYKNVENSLCFKKMLD